MVQEEKYPTVNSELSNAFQRKIRKLAAGLLSKIKGSDSTQIDPTGLTPDLQHDMQHLSFNSLVS